MRYLIRALKYYVQLMVILVLIIGVLVLAGFVESDISQIFVNGYDSLWQITLMMAVFAAIYPRFGYSRRTAIVPGDDDEASAVLGRVMTAFGYEPVTGKGGEPVWRKRAFAPRLFRLWEDGVRVSRCISGFELEGPSKDITRICSALRDSAEGQ